MKFKLFFPLAILHLNINGWNFGLYILDDIKLGLCLLKPYTVLKILVLNDARQKHVGISLNMTEENTLYA